MNIKKLVLIFLLLISSFVQAQPFGGGGVQYIKPIRYLDQEMGSRFYEIKCVVGQRIEVLHEPKNFNRWFTLPPADHLPFYLGSSADAFAQAACGSVNNAQGRVPNETVRSSSSAMSSNSNAPLATLDGNWYSPQWKYGYVLKDGVGVATSTNSPNFQVGQNILRLAATSSTTFVGQQVYKDGKFYQVNVKLMPDGSLHFEGEKNVKWVMERIGAPPQGASTANPQGSSPKASQKFEIPDGSSYICKNKNTNDMLISLMYSRTSAELASVISHAPTQRIDKVLTWLFLAPNQGRLANEFNYSNTNISTTVLTISPKQSSVLIAGDSGSLEFVNCMMIKR
jgi:hypothetical protein